MGTDNKLRDYYRFKHVSWGGPLYYDYPDGEDLRGKLTFCSGVAFMLSAPIGVVNAYMAYPYPTSQRGRILRVLSAVVPGVGMGVAFAAATYYATVFRKKDDAINHIIGGVAAGTIFGAATSLGSGVLASAILGGLAGCFKIREPRRKRTNQRRFPNLILRNKDFIKYPDKGDNWVKAPAPQN